MELCMWRPLGFCPKRMFIWLVENVYQVHFETTGQKHTTCSNDLGFWVILRFNFNSTVDSNLIFEILPPPHFKSNSKPFPAESFSGKLQEPSFLRKLFKRSNKKRCWKWVNCKYFQSHFLFELFCKPIKKKKQNHILGKGNHIIVKGHTTNQAPDLQYLQCSPLGPVQRQIACTSSMSKSSWEVGCLVRTMCCWEATDAGLVKQTTVYAKAIKAHLIAPPCPKTKISDFQQFVTQNKQ